jgi:hypothetical protein
LLVPLPLPFPLLLLLPLEFGGNTKGGKIGFGLELNPPRAGESKGSWPNGPAPGVPTPPPPLFPLKADTDDDDDDDDDDGFEKLCSKGLGSKSSLK